MLRVEGRRAEVAGEKGKSEGSTPAGCRMNRYRTHLARQSGVRESDGEERKREKEKERESEREKGAN